MVYREYTDGSFTSRKQRGPDEEHLGILGKSKQSTQGWNTFFLMFPISAGKDSEPAAWFLERSQAHRQSGTTWYTAARSFAKTKLSAINLHYVMKRWGILCDDLSNRLSQKSTFSETKCGLNDDPGCICPKGCSQWALTSLINRKQSRLKRQTSSLSTSWVSFESDLIFYVCFFL